ncbi:MAG: hypothetical protein GY947_19435 [Rhodobacteraceae bacterium]|nr:hypothetical protein [Paracoccaceae bacterium]
MIHMLSRFNLRPGVAPETFHDDYMELVAHMKTLNLVEGTGKVGQRETATPMDTDHDDAPEFYAVMSFRDRDQLDRSYAYLTNRDANMATTHPTVNSAVADAVFTCWRDLD